MLNTYILCDIDDINRKPLCMHEQLYKVAVHKSKLRYEWQAKMNESQQIQSTIAFQLIKIKTLLANAKQYELSCLDNFNKNNILKITNKHYQFHEKRYKKLYFDNIKLIQQSKYQQTITAISLAKLFLPDYILNIYKTLSSIYDNQPSISLASSAYKKVDNLEIIAYINSVDISTQSIPNLET